MKKTIEMPSQDVLNKVAANSRRKDACLLWTRPLDIYGYGEMIWKNRKFGIHRLALIWASDGIEHVGMMALHSCRNRHCIEPRHLRWGSAQDNVNDKIKDKTQIYGSSVPNAILTEKQVIDIFRKFHEEDADLNILRKEYKVTKITITRIGKRDAWKRTTDNIVLKKERTVTNKGRFIRPRSLPNDVVLAIWSAWHVDLLGYKEISEKFQVPDSTARSIMLRKTYADVTEHLQETRLRRRNRKFCINENNKDVKEPKMLKRRMHSQEVVDIWKKRHCEQLQQYKVASMFNTTQQTVRNIERSKTGRRFTQNLLCENFSFCTICRKYGHSTMLTR